LLREGQPQRAEPMVEAAAVREEPSIQPVYSPMTDRTSSEPMVEAAAAEPEKTESAEARPLISNEASEQVSRSFQSLALAVDDANRRSFDDIAADLLRPMLQEWLDDNLPTLVERLVREEIERVARGPRR
jgi:cell pole-organizing protein PopZ